MHKAIKKLFRDLFCLFDSFDYYVELETSKVLQYHYNAGFKLRTTAYVWLKNTVGVGNWDYEVQNFQVLAPPLCDKGMTVKFVFKSQASAVKFNHAWGGKFGRVVK